MRYIAAYALLVVGGNAAPTSEQVAAVVVAAGGEVDEAQIALLFTNLEGKDIHELLAKGEIDLKSVTSSGGGGGGGAAPAAGAAAAAPAAAAKAAAPVEEEVDALDGGMDMFGGGGAKTGDY